MFFLSVHPKLAYTIESILVYCFKCDIKGALVERLSSAGPPTLPGRHGLSRVSKIVSDYSHPGHGPFNLLSSGRRYRSCKSWGEKRNSF